MATVNLIDVCKQVGTTQILNQINLSIAKGEFMVVVGPSGCGKSSLLRLVAGLDDLSSGSILINNHCVNQTPASERDMAMVFQNYALYPHMTVFDNMAYGLKMRGFSKTDILKRVNETSKLLKLTPYLDRKPQALSGGQRQRVAMGRAMVRQPSVFLYDEPLSNLDAKLRTEMRHEIKRLHGKFNTTSLYVTHDQTEAMTMADRVVVLNQGIIEQVGSPQELYQNPSTVFVAGFTGHYPINFISGLFDKATGTIQTGLGVNFVSPTMNLEDKTKLVLAIRPEHVQLSATVVPKSIPLNIEFIDDMGADQLIQGRCTINGERIQIRVSADIPVVGQLIHVLLPQIKLHIYDEQTGMRLGDGL